MIATSDSFAPTAETPKTPRARAPRKPAGQSPRKPGERVAKCRDASLAKVSWYLPAELAKKIAIKAIHVGEDQSDLVAKALWPVFSSIAVHDRSTRPASEALTVMESAEA